LARGFILRARTRLRRIGRWWRSAAKCHRPWSASRPRLRFHELTTENPFEVWIALKQGAWTPSFEYPPIRVVRFSGPSLTFGAVEHTIEGAKIKVYSPAKTVADCFKFRSKVGTELAIQALRGVLSREKGVDGRTLGSGEDLPGRQRDAALYGVLT